MTRHLQLQTLRHLPLLGFLCICCLFLNACSSSKPEPLPWLSPESTILAFGDSLTYGTGAKRNESYPAVLSRRIERKIINAGIPGETTAEGLQRLPEMLDKTQPDLLLLCLGGNDFLRRQSAVVAKQNLAAMIQLAQQRDIPVVLLSVPELGVFLSAAPLYAELASEHKLVIENDIFADVIAEESLRADRVHPNAAGYQKVAEAIATLLGENGAL